MLPGFVYMPTGVVDEERLYNRSRVTDTYLRGQPIQAPAIALVVQAGELIGVGLLERGHAITSFERRISVANISLIGSPVPVSSISLSLPPRVRRRGDEVLHTGGPITPATWRALRAELERDAEFRERIRDLEARAAPPEWVAQVDERARQVIEQEQDAVGLSLSLAALDRDPLNSWMAPDGPAPFLQGLEHTELREDQLLVNDMLVFGAWQRVGANGLLAEFADREGRRVTVMNVNRHPLESTLGVDLIYYSHRHQAYTIVQYKRMRWEDHGRGLGSEPVYRPAHDKNIDRQISRMRAVESRATPGPPPSHLTEYRLGRSTCFLKICRPDLSLGTSELSKGMYMDLELWKLVVQHLASGGNPALRFDKDLRYLNNTEFIGLVRQGWIGSHGVTSKNIAAYISRSLQSRHSVTLAAASN